jgi:heme-degrading monooxygenase HmoA
MFVRILEFEVKMEKKPEFIKVVKNEILPILKKQPGFLELLPFFPENVDEKKVLNLSFWDNRLNAERYEKEWFPKVQEIIRPFLTTPITVKYYMLETTLAEHFEKAVAA